MIDFDDTERAVLAALQRHNVRFLIIGGHAVNAHGVERPVRDLDVLLDPTLANARRVIAAFTDLGEGGITAEQIAHPRRQIRLLRYAAELLTSLPGLSFHAAYARRTTVASILGDLPVLSRVDTVRSKRTTPRAKDRKDVRQLTRRRRGAMRPSQ